MQKSFLVYSKILCVRNAFQLCWNEIAISCKKNNISSSSYVLHVASKKAISHLLLEENGWKCTKLKNARAKRAILLIFIVKYTNLWPSRLPSRPGYLISQAPHSHFRMSYHRDLKVPSTNCKASRTTVNITTDLENKGKLCHRQPKLKALSCFQRVTS